MKMKQLRVRLMSLSLLMGAMFSFSACEGEMEVVQTINEEFSGIETVIIDASYMDVNVEGKSGQFILELDGILESSRSGNSKIEYRQEGSTLYIKMDQSTLGGGNHRATLTLIGPKGLDLKVNSGSGKTVISGIEHPKMEVASGSGEIEVFNLIVPSISLEASSGTIKGNDLVGNVVAEASSGSVIIDRLEGNLTIEVSSGSVEVSHLDGQLNTSLSSGSLKMNDVSELGSLKISSGTIIGTLVGLGPQTNLKSTSGNIRLETFSNLKAFNYNLVTGSGSVVLGQNSSTSSLKIDNGSPITIIGTVSSGSIEIKN